MNLINKYLIRRIRDLEKQLETKQKKIDKYDPYLLPSYFSSGERKYYESLLENMEMRYHELYASKNTKVVQLEAQLEKLENNYETLELENSRLLSKVALLGGFVEDHVNEVIERIKNETNL